MVKYLKNNLAIWSHWIARLSQWLFMFLSNVPETSDVPYGCSLTFVSKHFCDTTEMPSRIKDSIVGSSVTRLGDFWKFLEIHFLAKVAQMYVDFLGCLKTSIFMYKLKRLVNFGLLYISASSHTGGLSPAKKNVFNKC